MSHPASDPPVGSRLPRPANSPAKAPLSMSVSTSNPTLKRKPLELTKPGAAKVPASRPVVPRPAAAAPSSRPTSALGNSRSTLSSSSSSANGTRGTAARPLTVPRGAPSTSTRPPVTGRSVSASASSSSLRSTSAAGSASRATLSRLTSTGSGIGSGAATKGDLDKTNMRVEEMAKQMSSVQALLAEEQRKKFIIEENNNAMAAQLTQIKTSERETSRRLSSTNREWEEERRRHIKETMDLEEQLSKEQRKGREAKEDFRRAEEDLERERSQVKSLKAALQEQQTSSLTLQATVSAMTVTSQGHLSEISTLRAELSQLRAEHSALGIASGEEVRLAKLEVQRVESELREAETVRRKLHNLVQELKGNIRVFCRVRPGLGSPDQELADITYPDPKDATQIVLASSTESAMGSTREQVIPFKFDRIFQPSATQQDVFEEISALTQSVLDGYNVCIFAYGQTGSGKSYTMEGGQTPESMGMIPRAVQQIFTVTDELKQRGWEYSMEGQYLEIYNETINDLLGSGEFDKKKHEVKHEKNGRTTVTDSVTIPLKSANQVASILERAKGRRQVAATLMNERSSRSHSVFMLRVMGHNAITGESCEGVLNLVDLAGSERLVSSGAGENKDRLKETININKSLSALADVIGALGSGGAGGHVPYRNSKLTFLLQTSLSGQSKTLMVLNLSPVAAHMQESLCSLRFATKVNSTQIGTARKVQPRTS